MLQTIQSISCSCYKYFWKRSRFPEHSSKCVLQLAGRTEDITLDLCGSGNRQQRSLAKFQSLTYVLGEIRFGLPMGSLEKPTLR